ncbi:MAG: thiolase family protein [Burkholderiaceae bacterium]|nr:thiolase family protein [Burkholderiaceae bacterium]
MSNNNKGFAATYDDIWMVDGVRTPFVDYQGAFSLVSPIDLGIKVGRAALERAGVPATDVGSVVTGSVAQASFDAFMLPRHIGLYSGVPQEVGAILVQRICGTGFEIFRQAANDLNGGYADVALCVGTESMSRNPIASYTHRGGFRLGAPVEFKDFLWEALIDTAPNITMIQTAENLARKYGITREEVDQFAHESFERAVAAQADGFLAGEIVPTDNEKFELEGYASRGIELPRKTPAQDRDTHPRPSPVDALARLRPVYRDGVQTAGNSSALVDGAAGAVVARGGYVRDHGLKTLGRVAASAAVGVEPEYMGIGPVPAIRLLLERAGLSMDDIGCVEVNEAQGAQTLAVMKALEMDRNKLNVNGGAIAIGHPLAATGVRLTITVAREIRRRNQRWGISSACVGGGQGMALLIENPDYQA